MPAARKQAPKKPRAPRKKKADSLYETVTVTQGADTDTVTETVNETSGHAEVIGVTELKLEYTQHDLDKAVKEALDEAYERRALEMNLETPEYHVHVALQKVFPDWFDPGINSDLWNTPKRFVKYLQEFYNPFEVENILGNLFPLPSKSSSGIVVQGNIPFRMICAHHLLPAIGRAWVGYLPRRQVVGLSKIARLVEAVGTSKPGMQETACSEIATILHDYTDADGAICVIKSLHTCMACRGVNVPDTHTATSSVKGLFLTQPAVREEFFQIAGIAKE